MDSGRALTPFKAFFLFLTLLLAAAASAQDATERRAGQMTAADKEIVLKGISEVVTQRMFVPGVDFSKWPEHVAKHREELDKAEDERGFALVLNRALREYGLSHVRLRTPQAGRQRREGPTSVGLGIQAQKEEPEGLLITSVFSKSPAAEAGLAQGDLILSVDGRSPDSPAVLSGDPESKVALKVRKPSGEVLELELVRKTFSTARQDFLAWHSGDTALIRIHSFSRGYSVEGIEDLFKEASRAKALVLDLRNNGGGATNNLQHLLSLLLPNDTAVGAFISRRTMQEYERAYPDAPKDVASIAKWTDRKYVTRKRSVEPFAGKIAVLINRGSASASEICAAALREVAGAKLIGSRTAGAVLASKYARIGDWELQYPVTDYVTIKGLRLEGNPLQPDEEVSASGNGREDAVLAKALELLRASSKG
jgi:carboxyl-terminal processing protease